MILYLFIGFWGCQYLFIGFLQLFGIVVVLELLVFQFVFVGFEEDDFGNYIVMDKKEGYLYDLMVDEEYFQFVVLVVVYDINLLVWWIGLYVGGLFIEDYYVVMEVSCQYFMYVLNFMFFVVYVVQGVFFLNWLFFFIFEGEQFQWVFQVEFQFLVCLFYGREVVKCLVGVYVMDESLGIDIIVVGIGKGLQVFFY